MVPLLLLLGGRLAAGEAEAGLVVADVLALGSGGLLVWVRW